MRQKYVVGIDEAGRGPLAGPLAFGGVLMERSVYLKMKRRHLVGIRDSKKLTPKKREAWLEKMDGWQKEGLLTSVVCFAPASQIDKIGLGKCIHRSIADVLKKLEADSENTEILLDGGIRAHADYAYQKTIIKGDELEPIISLASIAAKVTRDRKMIQLHKKFPQYNFQKHKGYGTREHYENLQIHGLCVVHRRSFLRKFT